MEIIKGGVTAAKGFTASGMHVGLRRNVEKKDIALVYSDTMCNAAAVFTQNKIKANPIYVTSKHIQDGKAQAIIINSANANTFNGKEGLEHAFRMADATAEVLNLKPEDVLVASTGVIGFTLPMDIIESGIGMLKDSISDSRESAIDAATAILTTDTHKKEIAYEFEIGGKVAHIGAMCKGSGMIHPNMGTMLGFITTDVAIEQPLLQKALRATIEDTFNMVSVDGDTSTNDTVLVMANGLAENELISEENDDYNTFKDALYAVNEYLAKQIASDGEGATRLFEVNVVGAPDVNTAKILAKSIVTSNLTKCAIYGKDANWGRILCAMGYSGAEFDPDKVDITISSENGSIKLVENGKATAFDEDRATEILSPEIVVATADVKLGDAKATAWGCDLTYDYVKINADYRS